MVILGICIGLSYKIIFALCAPRLLYASKADYNDPNVEQEPEHESRSFADICTKLLNEIRKLVASQNVKVNADSEPDVVDKPELEPKPEVVDKPIQNQK